MREKTLHNGTGSRRMPQKATVEEISQAGDEEFAPTLHRAPQRYWQRVI